jgi:class 3 adenylate cyclase/tetratricopeptide (TPR) repeat protein
VSVVCSKCGFENSEQARFCGGCAAPLAEAAPARESRKTVTVVFCDVTGSTALGERLDPESLRRVMARYFEAMREEIERHGGTVEKFIGDAVMAVFGIPVVHEDDALRAVRAATGMRDALARLNEELERDYGTRLEARIGVNTGEVVTGTEERLATGDAVNVAARLEQAAAPGEVLVGRETYRLVRDAVEADELDPLELKGKAEGVTAYRLVAVAAEAPARRLDVAMVGRGRELRLLHDAWDRAVSERSCVLFTLLGVAGVGKSRLTAEFLSGVEATVVEGRCLSYGDGITYWPVTEIVLQLGAELPGVVGDAAVTSPEEIAFAFRRLLEGVARERPLVVLFDDCHWGEPTFFDLVEHVATMSRDAPILLLCVGRPDLLDRRPQWGGGMLNATTVLLEPLSAIETDELIQLLGGVDADLAGRIRAAADGNPLFVEEMLAMVSESGSGEVTVPPSVQALLAARLDQLDPDERDVLERGSVEGHVFHRGAVQALGTNEPVARLTALVRKDIVRPEQPTFAGEDAYRFRHILIRDAAYDALPKATRAELHERFAAWLDERGDLVEQEEIVGYHLEQAHRYRAELGPADEAARELGRRGAERLAAGGRAAIARGDIRAASGMLRRAVDLLPAQGSDRLRLLPELAAVAIESGDFDVARWAIDELARRGKEAGDEVAVARARQEELMLNSLVGGPADAIGAALEELAEIASLLERSGDRIGLAQAWTYIARTRFYMGDCAGAEDASKRALPLIREAGLRRMERHCYEWWMAAKRYGPTPVSEALAFVDHVHAECQREGIGSPTLDFSKIALLAMGDQLEAARRLLEQAVPLAAQFGVVSEMQIGMEGSRVHALAGDHEGAEALIRFSWETAGKMGETGFRSTLGTQLAESLEALGRVEEAAEILAEVETIVAPDDFDPRARLRWVRARMLAANGEFEAAEQLAREAVSLVDVTDYLEQRGDAHSALGSVLAAAGRIDEAEAEWRIALDLYERKGAVIHASRAREKLGGVNAA